MRLFANAESVADISMDTVDYGDLARKHGLHSDNRMRRVVSHGNVNHIKMVIWPKNASPKHQNGLENCYDTFLSATRAKVPFAELRDDPVPRVNDTGVLYLIPNFESDQKAHKWGSFKVEGVIRNSSAKEHLIYTLMIRKTDETTVQRGKTQVPSSKTSTLDVRTSGHTIPSTPKRKISHASDTMISTKRRMVQISIQSSLTRPLMGKEERGSR
jgi:hypothetical protein